MDLCKYIFVLFIFVMKYDYVEKIICINIDRVVRYDYLVKDGLMFY